MRRAVDASWYYPICHQPCLLKAFHSTFLPTFITTERVPHIGSYAHRLCNSVRNNLRPRQHLWLQTDSRNMGSHTFAGGCVYESANKVHGAFSTEHRH